MALVDVYAELELGALRNVELVQRPRLRYHDVYAIRSASRVFNESNIFWT